MVKVRHLIKGIGLLTALACAAPQNARADANGLGLGLMLGEPTGISGKLWLDPVHAIDFALGSFGYYVGSPYDGVNIHADYLWHYYGIFGDRASEAYRRMPLYLGAGAVFSTPGVAGVRGVMGVTYLFDAPFDLFLEIAPTLVLAPSVGLGTDAGFGGRFYF
jgi:hypothetical protein